MIGIRILIFLIFCSKITNLVRLILNTYLTLATYNNTTELYIEYYTYILYSMYEMYVYITRTSFNQNRQCSFNQYFIFTKMNIVDGTDLIYLPSATRTKRSANRDGGMLLTESGTLDEKLFVKTLFINNNSATNLSITCFVKVI